VALIKGGKARADKLSAVEGAAAAIALHTTYCNFVRIHQTLKVTPAMATGISEKLWEVSDIVEMLEQWELANFKPQHKFRRSPICHRQGSLGQRHVARRRSGFEKEADALQWIKEKSQAWLIEQNRVKRVE
jgi:hypothetical protein